MTRLRASSAGFTILEVLITIVVIGIISAITFVAYSGIQERSRDATRDSDVALIKIALEKYFAENSEFPDVCAGGDNSDCSANNLASSLRPYLPEIPQDPRFQDNPNAEYRYIRGGTSGNAYALRVTNEALEQCKTGVRVEVSWFGADVPDCAQAGSFAPVVPTITNTTLPIGYSGFAYPSSTNPEGEDAAVYTNGTQPITYTITAGALPAGLSLSATTGELSGTPTVSGTFNFTVQAANSAGSDSQAYSLTISPLSPP